MSRCCGVLAFFKYGVGTMAVILGVLYWMNRSELVPFEADYPSEHWGRTHDIPEPPLIEVHSIVPEELGTLYQPTDFENKLGIVPSFWTFDNTTNHNYTEAEPPSWGPCYVAQTKINWDKEIKDAQTLKINKYSRANKRSRPSHPEDVRGGCRPGFLIIGAGKCGTSSLYHYLTGHPRVLPALIKQIHYFKVSFHLYYCYTTTNNCFARLLRVYLKYI
jgi:hypothetical protein